jgi:hypothetical protein
MIRSVSTLRGRVGKAGVRLRAILRDAAFVPPRALRRLACITDFELFLTTIFDSLLEQAINSERYGGVPSTEVICYARSGSPTFPASAIGCSGRWSITGSGSSQWANATSARIAAKPARRTPTRRRSSGRSGCEPSALVEAGRHPSRHSRPGSPSSRGPSRCRPLWRYSTARYASSSRGR